ncbi:eukaryotic translation initiation factor 4B1-like [Phalaenopsis equestris]|uniref:eukaryotic translation initiation factor 4B1-like n=1 Tax=Phalaenopsis equestris TaxID=78828 RepID=UPI0009E4C60B|nr:eukaryotic translation initiation factor 4B1-like [Phalaenopsis equestris]
MATMSKPWSRVGAWALETERAEAEEPALTDADSYTKTMESFPTLNEAAASGEFSKHKKKKKGISFTLSEFATGTYVGPGGAHRGPTCESKGLTAGEMLLLPTGPRERTADEIEHSRFRGGFRSYGYGGDAPPRRVNDLPHRASDRDQTSRADEVDNWASVKKPFPMDLSRQARSGSLGTSKADEVDDWSAGKKAFAPLSGHSGFGSGMHSDHLGRGNASLSRNGERERPRLVLDPPKRDSESQPEPAPAPARSRSNPFAAARPREEVLAEKGLDWRKMESEIEMKKANSYSSRSSSSQSSRPGSSDSKASEEGGVVKPRHKVNPFGDAKPREVLLEEKGMDWRKIDQELEHRGIDRSETDEEKKLKEEIDHLKKELCSQTEGNMNSDSLDHSTEQCDSLLGKIKEREKELENLIHELDDKVRFVQRASADSRPGSGSGRAAFSADKLSVQNGVSEGSRQTEFGSRGTSDSWSRPVSGKRGFLSSKDSGFLGNRSMNRLKSGERW